MRIETGQLSVKHGAEVTASNEGLGNAGKLEIVSRNLLLDKGVIRAGTTSGTGGNIMLQLQDLLLRHGSTISTTAGTAQTGGDGGDITINTDLIVAVPNEDSDITANAFKGQGGNIEIRAQGIFGLEERPAIPRNGTNDIDASSELGVSGNVQLNTPDIDPSQELANLPIEPVNPVIAQECQAGSEPGTSRFISSGRGGLPTNPYELLDSSDILAEVQLPTQWANAEDTGTSSRQQMPLHRVSASAQGTLPNQIIEAQGWSVNDKGEVVLVAEVPHNSSRRGCRLH